MTHFQRSFRQGRLTPPNTPLNSWFRFILDLLMLYCKASVSKNNMFLDFDIPPSVVQRNQSIFEMKSCWKFTGESIERADEIPTFHIYIGLMPHNSAKYGYIIVVGQIAYQSRAPFRRGFPIMLKIFQFFFRSCSFTIIIRDSNI